MADRFDMPQSVRLDQLPEVTTAALNKVLAERKDETETLTAHTSMRAPNKL